MHAYEIHHEHIIWRDWETLKLLFHEFCYLILEKIDSWGTPRALERSSFSGGVWTDWWGPLGRWLGMLEGGSPPRREQALKGHVGRLARPPTSGHSIHFFPRGWLSRQHQRHFWFQRPGRVRGSIVPWGQSVILLWVMEHELCITSSVSRPLWSFSVTVHLGLEDLCTATQCVVTNLYFLFSNKGGVFLLRLLSPRLFNCKPGVRTLHLFLSLLPCGTPDNKISSFPYELHTFEERFYVLLASSISRKTETSLALSAFLSMI